MLIKAGSIVFLDSTGIENKSFWEDNPKYIKSVTHEDGIKITRDVNVSLNTRKITSLWGEYDRAPFIETKIRGDWCPCQFKDAVVSRGSLRKLMRK